MNKDQLILDRDEAEALYGLVQGFQQILEDHREKLVELAKDDEDVKLALVSFESATKKLKDFCD